MTFKIKQVQTVDSSNNYLAEFAKSIGHKSWNLELPRLEYDLKIDEDSEELSGERLLVILSHPTDEDIRGRRLGKAAQGALVKTLIDQLHKEVTQGIRKDLPLVKEVGLINFRDKADEKMIEVGTDFETDYSKAWVDRIIAYVNDYKPTRILISSEGPLQAILYHTQSQIKNHQDFERVEYKEPYLQVGRIFDFHYGDLVVPTSFTLPFHWTSTSNPKYIEEAPTLIHQQKFHLEHLLYGKNLYTVSDMSSWSKVDVMTMEAFYDFYEKLKEASKVAIDLETDNLSRFANKILTAHFCLDGTTAYNIPMCHRETPFNAEELLEIQSMLKEYLQDGKTVEHVYHNAKFDIGVLAAQLGLIYYNHKVVDTQATTYSLDENAKQYVSFKSPPYNLRRLAYQYGCAAYDEGEIGKADRTRMATVPLKDIFEYAAKDVIIPYQISSFQFQEAERRNYYKWKEFIIEQLGAMVLVFIFMENKGILVDKKYLLELCSNDGIVKKLLDGVLDQFKQSPNAQKVNEILVIRKRVVDMLTSVKLSLRKDLSSLRKHLKSIEKPKKILAKDKNNVSLVAAVTKQNELNKEVFSKAFGVEKNYEELTRTVNSLSKVLDDSIYELKEYDNHVQNTKIHEMFDTIIERVSLLPEFLKSIMNLKSSVKSLKEFRDIPVDHEKEWAFSITKQDTQQLLYFNVLGLKPVESRKDGGGTTDKYFQTEYLHIPEVEYLATHNKYKKLMTTYILGMLSRLEEDADSQLDGRLRADYGYKDVATGRCLRGDVKVLSDQGEIEIEELVQQRVLCKVLTHTGMWQQVTDWFENGIKEVFELELVSGKKVQCTANHPLLTDRGWIELKDLTKDDLVYTLS